jgi:hypothetical protein
MHAIELVNEGANHQAQQIYFGIAAINGHDADLVTDGPLWTDR